MQNERQWSEMVSKAKSGHVEPDGSFWCWLPQVGGYVSPCRVHSLGDGVTNSCFDVDVYTDGEFCSDFPVTLHFCDVEQIERFASTVKAKLAKASTQTRSGR